MWGLWFSTTPPKCFLFLELWLFGGALCCHGYLFFIFFHFTLPTQIVFLNSVWAFHTSICKVSSLDIELLQQLQCSFIVLMVHYCDLQHTPFQLFSVSCPQSNHFNSCKLFKLIKLRNWLNSKQLRDTRSRLINRLVQL